VQKKYKWIASTAAKQKDLWRRRAKDKRSFVCGESMCCGQTNRYVYAVAENDDDDDEENVSYCASDIRVVRSTNANARKIDYDNDDVKFDPLEFIPYFLYAWVVLGFVLPSVVSSLPIAQEQDDGGIALLYTTRLCSEVAKLAYLSYALKKRSFNLNIGSSQHVISGVVFGIGTSVAARVAEKIISPSLVELSSSASHASSISAAVTVILSSTVLAPITEELFFRGVVLECGLNIFQQSKQKSTRVFSTVLANVFAAVIFSLAHFNFSMSAMLNLFICGIGFGFAFLSSERRNITVPIIAHSVYNASVLIESYANEALFVQ